MDLFGLVMNNHSCIVGSALHTSFRRDSSHQHQFEQKGNWMYWRLFGRLMRLCRPLQWACYSPFHLGKTCKGRVREREILYLPRKGLLIGCGGEAVGRWRGEGLSVWSFISGKGWVDNDLGVTAWICSPLWFNLAPPYLNIHTQKYTHTHTHTHTAYTHLLPKSTYSFMDSETYTQTYTFAHIYSTRIL